MSTHPTNALYLIRETVTFEVVSELTGEVVAVEETRDDAQKVIDRLTYANNQVLARLDSLLLAIAGRQ